MLISVPDTPYGAALGQFLLLFERRPIDLAHLHAAFADLSVIALRDHPEIPWPMQMNIDQQPASMFTVEGLLAYMRKSSTSKPTVDEATVTQALALWNGAKVENTMASTGMGPDLRIYLVRKPSLGPQRGHFHECATLAADCAWKLLKNDTLLCSSTDADPELGQMLSKALKGARLLASRVETGGILSLVFNRGSLLEISPFDFSIGPDYSFYVENKYYSRFNGSFVMDEIKEWKEAEETLPEH
jgi:hypothetical protein